MSFGVLPDDLLPTVFSHLSPGTILRLSMVGTLHIHSDTVLVAAVQFVSTNRR